MHVCFLFSIVMVTGCHLTFLIDCQALRKQVLSNMMCVRGQIPDDSRDTGTRECCAAAKSNFFVEKLMVNE